MSRCKKCGKLVEGYFSTKCKCKKKKEGREGLDLDLELEDCDDDCDDCDDDEAAGMAQAEPVYERLEPAISYESSPSPSYDSGGGSSDSGGSSDCD